MSRLTQYFRTVPEFAVPKIPAYEWDPWIYTDYFYHETPEMLDRFGMLTGLGIRALCIAIGEWIAQRLSEASRIADARDYLDAAWVTMIRRDSCEYAELPHDEWTGPLDGVLRAAILVVNDAVFDAEQDLYFAERACWSVNLARHIVDQRDSDAFEDWLETSVERLLQSHSGPTVTSDSIFDRNFSFGAPVGPSLFVLTEQYDPGRADAEIAGLANSQIGRNRYLRLKAPIQLG
jgi:hypothetical protein